MTTILTVFGTRPEAIKMAPVVQELGRRGDRVKSIVCSTGQHRQMLDQVCSLFQIQVDRELNVMQPNQSLSGLTARLCDGLDAVVAETQPDWILAQGDTTTVLAAALVGFYRRVRFGHVEAGLRTGDLQHPFPEELNRRVADEIATLWFAPTNRSRDVLLREGKPAERVLVTGNTVIDALQHVSRQPFDWSASSLPPIPSERRIVLVTAHRRESFGGPFQEMCQALRELALAWGPKGVDFIYPVHLNPNVQEPVRATLGNLPHMHLLPPLDYLALVHLMRRSTLVLTDSGGIQEEAPGLKVPVLVMRDTTERPEGIDAGVVRLVGTSRARIVAEAGGLLADEGARQKMITGANPYGDGLAASRIVDAVLSAG